VWPEKKLMYCILSLHAVELYFVSSNQLWTVSAEKRSFAIIMIYYHGPTAVHIHLVLPYTVLLYMLHKPPLGHFFLQFPPCGGLICCKFHHLVI
jgi:hypothetical protein